MDFQEVVEVLVEEVQVEAGKKPLFRLKNPLYFLTKREKEAIIQTIKEVESFSLCEIRVHLAKKTKGDIIEEAKKAFYRLGMQNTKERNGVLFYLSIKDRRFAIIGDKGINEKVGENFWIDTAKKMEKYFKEGFFGEGITIGIKDVGKILKEFFPHSEDDKNELPDEISSG